jgi:hypothetical protein
LGSERRKSRRGVCAPLGPFLGCATLSFVLTPHSLPCTLFHSSTRCRRSTSLEVRKEFLSPFLRFLSLGVALSTSPHAFGILELTNSNPSLDQLTFPRSLLRSFVLSRRSFPSLFLLLSPVASSPSRPVLLHPSPVRIDSNTTMAHNPASPTFSFSSQSTSELVAAVDDTLSRVPPYNEHHHVTSSVAIDVIPPTPIASSQSHSAGNLKAPYEGKGLGATGLQRNASTSTRGSMYSQDELMGEQESGQGGKKASSHPYSAFSSSVLLFSFVTAC